MDTKLAEKLAEVFNLSAWDVECAIAKYEMTQKIDRSFECKDEEAELALERIQAVKKELKTIIKVYDLTFDVFTEVWEDEYL